MLFYILLTFIFYSTTNATTDEGPQKLASSSKSQMTPILILSIVALTLGLTTQSPGVLLIGVGLLVTGALAASTGDRNETDSDSNKNQFNTFNFYTTWINMTVDSFSEYLKHTDGTNRQLNFTHTVELINKTRLLFPRSSTLQDIEKRDSIEIIYELVDEGIYSNLRDMYWDAMSHRRPERVKAEMIRYWPYYSDVEIYYVIKWLWQKYDYQTFDYLVTFDNTGKIDIMVQKRVGDYRYLRNTLFCLFMSRCALNIRWSNTVTNVVIRYAFTIVGLWLLISPPISWPRKKVRIAGAVLAIVGVIALVFQSY